MDEEKLNDEDFIDIDLGDESTFYVANNGNYFGIGFDKMFRTNRVKCIQ